MLHRSSPHLHRSDCQCHLKTKTSVDVTIQPHSVTLNVKLHAQLWRQGTYKILIDGLLLTSQFHIAYVHAILSSQLLCESKSIVLKRRFCARLSVSFCLCPPHRTTRRARLSVTVAHALAHLPAQLDTGHSHHSNQLNRNKSKSAKIILL